MSDEEIIQIIPAPPNAWVTMREPTTNVFIDGPFRVVALALVREDGFVDPWVRAVIDFAGDIGTTTEFASQILASETYQAKKEEREPRWGGCHAHLEINESG